MYLNRERLICTRIYMYYSCIGTMRKFRVLDNDVTVVKRESE